MKITVFNGSPWGREGHTYIITQEFAMGALKAGAKIQSIQLREKNIKICDRCGTCFYKTPGKCILKDDMSDLIKKFLDCDVAVLATPIYMDNVTAMMKLFIDRLVPILDPHYQKDDSGEYRRALRFGKCPKLLVISSCAMPEQTHFQFLRLYFRRLARTLHTELVGELYRAAAGLLLLGKEEIRFMHAVTQYKALLREAGEEFVKTGSINSEMAERLERPLVDADEYAAYANRMWDKILPKHHLKVFA